MPSLQSGHGPLVSIVICNYNYGRFIRSAGAHFFTVHGSCLNSMVVALDSVLGNDRLHGSFEEANASLVFEPRLNVDLPERLVSFSTRKQRFVVEVLSEPDMRGAW